MLGTGIIDDGEAVLCFAASVIVCAFTVAYAAKIGQVAVEAEFAQCFGGGLDDFVGVCPALEGVGMIDDGNTACRYLFGWDMDGF